MSLDHPAADPQRSIFGREPDPDAAIPRCVLIAGASGGIGHALACRIAADHPDVPIVRLARKPQALAQLPARTIDVGFELGDEDSIRKAVASLPETPEIDWVFVATGWLHGQAGQPEKTYRSLSADLLMHAYRINAIGPALLIKHLLPRLSHGQSARIGVLSARVGSISDNRLGGWHAYRASKAALNMLIRNFAIEFARLRPPHIIVGLQPGTTDTALSAPFQRHLVEGQLQTPAYTARHLVEVMRALRNEDSGGLFDFLGIPFAP